MVVFLHIQAHMGPVPHLPTEGTIRKVLKTPQVRLFPLWRSSTQGLTWDQFQAPPIAGTIFLHIGVTQHSDSQWNSFLPNQQPFAFF